MTLPINWLAVIIAALVLFPTPLKAAGVASLAISSGSGVPGGTTLLNLTLSSSGGAQPSASQWVISYPVQNVSAMSLTASAAVTNAQKQLTCVPGSTAGTLNCILVGLNQSVIPTGNIATISVQVSANPSSSAIPIGVSGVTFSDPDGRYVDLSPIPTGGSIALPILAVQPSSLSCNPSSVNAPGTSTCTVTLSAAAPVGGVTVNLSSSNSGIQVPASVAVPSGSTSQTFSATVGTIATNLSSVITATAGGASKTFALAAVAPATLSSLACSPATVLSGQTTTCTVTLTKAASSAFVVTLTSSNATALPAPARVSVPAGSSAATFTATAATVSSNQAVTMTAAAAGVSKTFAMTVGTLPAVSGLVCTPATVNAPGTANCTVTLSAAAPGGGVSVALLSSNVKATLSAANVTVPASATTAAFTVTASAVTSDETAVVTAEANGGSRTFSLALAAPVVLSTLACAPATVLPGQTTTCTATLNKVTPSAFAVALASSNGTALPVPAGVSVPAGSSMATFTATAGTAGSNQEVTVTATAGGVSKTLSMRVGSLPTVSGLVCTPATLNAPGKANCTVTLSAAAPAGGVSVALSSGNVKATLSAASVTVAASATTAAFTVAVSAVTTDETAVVTAEANGGSRTFSLTLTTPVVLSTLTCSPATVLPGQTTTCTVTLSRVATNTFEVSLASSSTTTLRVPDSLSVSAGSSTATFTATARTINGKRNDKKFSGSTGLSTATTDQTVTVTATAGGVSKTIPVTIESSAQLLSLVCSPNTVIGPTHSSCTLSFSSATPASGVPATLTSESVNVTAPGVFTVPAGVKSVSLDIPVMPVTAPETAVLTAMVDGVVKSASLTIEASRSVPTVEVERPVTEDTYTTTRPITSLSGTATPSTGATLTEVAWSNDRGGSGTATGTTNWSIESVNLLPGENTVIIRATDSLGKIGSTSLLVTYDSGPAISTKAGVFRNGAFYLGDGTGSWDAPAQVAVAMFGVPGDVAVLGNWDGTGPLAIGVFRRGEWFLDFNRNGVWDGPSIDRYGNFGADGDVPVVGDWDGSARSRIGVFRNGTWLLDVNGNMTWDAGFDWSRSFGAAGDSPIMGDWDGSGRTKIGVFRHGLWLLDLNGNGTWDGPSKDRTGTFGAQGDKPLIGDWTGQGSQRVGVYRSGTFYLDLDGDLQFDSASDKTAPFEGQAGDIPVVGDWIGDRITRIGLFRSGIWRLDLDGDGRWDPLTDRTTFLGQTGDQPITGEWVISPRPPGQ